MPLGSLNVMSNSPSGRVEFSSQGLDDGRKAAVAGGELRRPPAIGEGGLRVAAVAVEGDQPSRYRGRWGAARGSRPAWPVTVQAAARMQGDRIDIGKAGLIGIEIAGGSKLGEGLFVAIEPHQRQPKRVMHPASRGLAVIAVRSTSAPSPERSSCR
jgi:hypothetical protein